jgi:hypothetical protein
VRIHHRKYRNSKSLAFTDGDIMKRSLHRPVTIGVVSILAIALAADATAAPADIIHQSGLGRSEFGPVIRPPAAIPVPSAHPPALATREMSATDRHVREFLDWKARHAPPSGGFGGPR